jgi:RNA polymerase sigma-70 factor (ECF subfamily)
VREHTQGTTYGSSVADPAELEDLGAQRPELVEPLVLRDVQELDYNEIASLLDVPLGTVKSRIHAARTAVRPLLRVSD